MKKQLCIIMAGAIIALAGCATGGASDQELIQNVVERFAAGFVAQDLAACMGDISDDYDNYQFGDKKGLSDFLEMSFSSGEMDNAKVSLEDMKITIEGDKATAYPIDVTVSAGSATIEFTLAKKGGAWVIVGSDSEEY